MTTTMADMTAEFLDTILPNKDGWLTGAVGHGGHFNGTGKYEFAKFEPFAYHWPARRDEAIDWIQQWAPTCDVYTCPYLQKTAKRVKGGAVHRQLVHTDVDGTVDLAEVYALGGFALWSGTPGHTQVYVPLSYVVMPAQHVNLCRGLTAHLNGDRGKVSDNDLLRPSGSRNQKAVALGGTAGFVIPAGTIKVPPVDPFELALKLGIDINAGPGSVPPPATVNLTGLEPFGPLPPKVNDELAIDSGDQSKDTYRIICACVDCGLSLPRTRFVIDLRPAMAARIADFFNRNPPVDDVLVSYNKALGEWQRKNQQAPGPTSSAASGPGAAPPPPQPTAPLPGPGRFFSRTGLRALDLTNEVMAAVDCGFGPLDERFYTYDGGVWTPGAAPIEAEITRLLGNRYRLSHTSNVTTLIKYQPGCARISDAPLADYINVVNGMIRWETGDLLPHNRDYYSTVQLPIEYAPTATCPRFEKYLREVLPADLIDSGFIWELIGYTLYSGNPHHVAVLLFGKGRNGKGVLIRVLKELLGECNVSAVTLHELTENRFRVATLYQKLANLAGDLDSKWLENTALFKKITGHDTLQGEYKYGASFNFDPWALPFYSANKAFGSPDSSEGWVARWVVVPFPNSFLGREDRTLDAKLTSESELRGILARGVAALPALMARGNFADLASLREAKQAFVLASDVVRAWVEECCVLAIDAWTPRNHLYRAYQWHTASDGSKQLSAREFYNRIEQIGGVTAAGRKGIRGFRGIRCGVAAP